MEVADDDKSVRDAVRVPGHVVPVEIENQFAKRIARLGDRGVAQRADLVNCKLPAPSFDRPERRARLGKASVDEPMLPQAVARPKNQQLFLHCLHLDVLVVEFPPPLGKGDDVVAAAPCVKHQLWLQVLPQDVQEVLRECLGAAQTITTSPLGAGSKKPSQRGRQTLQGSVHGRTGKRFCHGGHLVSANKGLFVFVSGLCRANVVSRRHMFALSCVVFNTG